MENTEPYVGVFWKSIIGMCSNLTTCPYNKDISNLDRKQDNAACKLCFYIPLIFFAFLFSYNLFLNLNKENI